MLCFFESQKMNNENTFLIRRRLLVRCFQPSVREYSHSNHVDLSLMATLKS
jgi:hypothetical protein